LLVPQGSWILLGCPPMGVPDDDGQHQLIVSPSLGHLYTICSAKGKRYFTTSPEVYAEMAAHLIGYDIVTEKHNKFFQKLAEEADDKG
jgi:hypothetical protein